MPGTAAAAAAAAALFFTYGNILCERPPRRLNAFSEKNTRGVLTSKYVGGDLSTKKA